MALVDLVDAFKKAIPSWDPAKHPRDRDGQFIETGDLVHAYKDKTALEPEVVGRVHAAYFAPDGRLFVGVESYGYVRWYRPKQLEHVKAKAYLKSGKEKPPELPLPAVDAQYDEVFYTNDEPFKVDPGSIDEVIQNPQLADLTVKKSDLDQEFLEAIGLAEGGPSPSSVPQPNEVKIPAGKTPDDLLRMIVTSYDNKGIAKTVGESNQYKADFEEMLADPDFKSAAQKLATLMTTAKLGGKQRKRYNSILAQKYGGHQVAEFSPAAEPEPDPLQEWEEELLAPADDGTQILDSPPATSDQAYAAAIENFAMLMTEGDEQLVHDVANGKSPSYSAVEVQAAKDVLAEAESVSEADAEELMANNGAEYNTDNDALIMSQTADTGKPPAPPLKGPLLPWQIESMPEHAQFSAYVPGSDPGLVGGFKDAIWQEGPGSVVKVATDGSYSPTAQLSAKQALLEAYQEKKISAYQLQKAFTADELAATMQKPSDGDSEYENTTAELVNAWKDSINDVVNAKFAAVQTAKGQHPAYPTEDQIAAAQYALVEVWAESQGTLITDADLEEADIDLADFGGAADKTSETPAGGGKAFDYHPDAYEIFHLWMAKDNDADAVMKAAIDNPSPGAGAAAKQVLAEAYWGLHGEKASSLVGKDEVEFAGITSDQLNTVGAPVHQPVPTPDPGIDQVWFDIANGLPNNVVVYSHPQGAVIVAYPSSGTVVKYNASGKKASTSATYDKLVAGHGQWTQVGFGPQGLIDHLENSGPGSAPAAPAAAPTATKAPEVDHSQDEVLLLLKTSMQNKGRGGTWDEVEAKFKQLLASQNYDDAIVRLNALMTEAKLGGKQRKRYKDALAAKYGIGPNVIDKGSSATKIGGAGGWAAIAPSSGTNQTPVGTTGPTKGNALVNPTYATPQAAKATIQEQLAQRLKGKATMEQLTASILQSKFQYGDQFKKLASSAKAHGGSGGIGPGETLVKHHNGMWEVRHSSAYGGKESIPNPTPQDWERAMLETVANSLIQQWAGTSNDHNARSLALQEAAVEEFSLTDTYEWPADTKLKADTNWELNKHRKLYRVFLREMYNNTQEWAKTNGVKRVRLRRGSGQYAGPVGSVANAKLRPMSSFSTNYGTAAGFGSNRIEAYVPIEWVIGNAATGYGCQSEYEWVILGGTHQVRVIK